MLYVDFIDFCENASITSSHPATKTPQTSWCDHKNMQNLSPDPTVVADLAP